MTQMCSVSGCPKDKIYTIEKDGKVYRLTFSRSLADHICRVKPGFTQSHKVFVYGDELKPGEVSKSGLYAVTKTNGWALRITMFPELAETWRDKTRKVYECWLE